MKKLMDDLTAFCHTLDGYLMEFEDDYNSPNTAKNLKRIRTQLVKFKEYKPTLPTDEPQRDQQKAEHSYIKAYMEDAIEKIDKITAESNVFDILDTLRDILQIFSNLTDPND